MSKIAEVQCVLVVAPNYWGKGKTKQEADRQLKAAGYRPQKQTKENKGKIARAYYLFTCPPEEVHVTSDVDVRWRYKQDAQCVKMYEYL